MAVKQWVVNMQCPKCFARHDVSFQAPTTRPGMLKEAKWCQKNVWCVKCSTTYKMSDYQRHIQEKIMGALDQILTDERNQTPDRSQSYARTDTIASQMPRGNVIKFPVRPSFKSTTLKKKEVRTNINNDGTWSHDKTQETITKRLELIEHNQMWNKQPTKDDKELLERTLVEPEILIDNLGEFVWA